MKINNPNPAFVVFRTEDTHDMFRLDSINKISVDTSKDENGIIKTVDLYIDDAYWDSARGDGFLGIGYWRELHPEVLNAINAKLRAGASEIDLDVLVAECIARVRENDEEYEEEE